MDLPPPPPPPQIYIFLIFRIIILETEYYTIVFLIPYKLIEVLEILKSVDMTKK